MTRLTNQHYLNQRNQLTEEWKVEGGGAFIMLKPNEQWALHDFYAFTEKLTDDQAIRHRKAAAANASSLPQRAGRALSHLAFFAPRLYEFVAARTIAPKRAKGAKTELLILSEVNPNLNADKMASILRDIVKERQKRDGHDKAA
ncbi:hypothetical protein KPL76_00090 [Subtercola sp. PAMC28395]|uniref:hypothetical protein n=1 Tax=Subtercola sp. PAMC28395 TaxID=2846775 RepID=UPI001C0C4085|nr:hypothetical protein [Subtercola sp. PAMC28395]QWT23897.1 hypothetical protein KPL76_00090 [Subtercola sp. PAMC28395]